MAVEIRDFTVTIPAGTAISAGFTSALSFPARVVTEIRVRVPPGPRGEVGFALGSGGIPIVPFGAGNWVVTDNEDLIYPLDDTITSGAWQLLGYNTGSFDHTLRIYFLCQLVTASSAGATTTLLPPGSLAGSGSADTGGAGGTGGGGAAGGGDGGGGIAGTGGTGGTGVPVITPPLILPPSFPGLGTGGAPPVPQVLLVGAPDQGTVGLLVGGGYYPLSLQSDVDALSGGGLVGVEVSDGTDGALRQASPHGAAGVTGTSGA